MAKQDITIKTTDEQKVLLDLEKKYFLALKNIISTEDFRADLLAVETEIKYNYDKLNSTWKIKNKIKVAAERLVCHHVYKNLMPKIIGIYESPISSDLGIVFDDCVLCVDCKTLDTVSNCTDINYTSVEVNQTSFDNSNHPITATESNLQTRSKVSRLPVLTYIIKIIYTDDNVRFDVSRSTNIDGKPSLVLVCIPNGELSNLFNKDLIENFKTYKYYTEKDGSQYTPVPILNSSEEKEVWTRNYCLSKRYKEIKIPQKRGSKVVYFDAIHKCYWTCTSDKKTKMIRAILRGDSMRYNNDYLRDRFDSENNAWAGYEEMDL